MKKKLLLNAVNADGLLDVTRLSEEFCTNAAGKNIVIKDIVDWPMGERDRYEFGKINLVPNCWFYMALCRMVQLSLQLGKTCEAEIFSRPITPLRNAIRNTICILRTVSEQTGVFPSGDWSCDISSLYIF